MSNLRDIRQRIKSVGNTQKITKAMEVVAASKLRRAQELVEESRPYADELTNVVSDLIGRSHDYVHPYLVVREVKRKVLILITSDRGLAGAVNNNNIRMAVQEIATSIPTGVVAIGRKGRDMMRRLEKELIAEISPIGDRPSLGAVLPAIRVAMNQYEAGEADQVDVIFARFVNAGNQVASLRRILPVEPPKTVGVGMTADFLYEPSVSAVLNALLPRYIESKIYEAVLENMASEHGARMVAMHNASDNADELIDDLTLTGNKLRQATITTELIEIVSGAAALSSQN